MIQKMPVCLVSFLPSCWLTVFFFHFQTLVSKARPLLSFLPLFFVREVVSKSKSWSLHVLVYNRAVNLFLSLSGISAVKIPLFHDQGA